MVFNAANLQWADLDLLKTHHEIDVQVYLMTTDRRVVFDVSQSLVSGTIDIDVDGEATRFGKISILDPQQRVSIDLNGLGWGSNISNRMAQVVYRVWSIGRTQTYACPVFTGPIVTADRDGVMLDIGLKGMEDVLQVPMTTDYTWPAGWSRANVIINAAAIVGGITDIQYNSDGGIMGGDWSVQRGDNLWERLKTLADAGGINIFFDGNGVLQIRAKDATNVDMGLDSTWLLEEPEFSLDQGKLFNTVIVEGANIPGTETRMTYEAWPPASHPFSPQSLARNGVPRVIPQIIRDDGLKSWADVINSANTNLAWNLIKAESDSAVTPVIPFLEEYDLIEINHPKMWARAPLTKATIPLVGDATMSLNMFSTTSVGSLEGSGGAFLTRQTVRNRLNATHISLTHGFHPALNQHHIKGEDWYTGEDGGKGAPNKGGKGKGKKNRNKGKHGKGR